MFLLTMPALVASPEALETEKHTVSSNAFHDIITYDEIMYFLNEIESGNFETYCNKNDLEQITSFVALLASQGGTESEGMKDDIAFLLEGRANPYEYAFDSGMIKDYTQIVTRVNFKSQMSYSHSGLVVCGSWWNIKWEKLKNFCHEHKAAIIIGATVVIATVVVVTLTARPAPVAGAGLAGLSRSTQNKNTKTPKDEATNSKPPTLEKEYASSQNIGVINSAPSKIDLSSDLFSLNDMPPITASEFMGEILSDQLPFIQMELSSKLPPIDNIEDMASFSERAKDIVSYTLHATWDVAATCSEILFEKCESIPGSVKYDDSSPLGYEFHSTEEDNEAFVADIHTLLDKVFSTEHAKSFSKEEKDKRPLNFSDLALIINPKGVFKNLSKFTKKEVNLIQKLQKLWKNKSLNESYKKFIYAQKYLKQYNKPLPEKTIRAYIHKVGIKTFPRPKGIPKNYIVRISDKGAGMVYIHPTNNHFSIRVMPGKPYSPWPHQQKPYIIQRIHDKAYDKHGNIVKFNSKEAHIPLEQYIYREN
jgi:hypothetical protein